MTEKRINDIGLVFCVFHQTGWPCKDGTIVSTDENSRRLTNISSIYDEFIMKMLITSLVNDPPHLNNLPIVPVKINEHQTFALIDTGAESTCINILSASKYELKPNGKNGWLRTISDKVKTEYIGFDAKFNWVSEDGFTPVDGFPLSFCGIPFLENRDKYDVIIGRDILKKVTLIYDGKNRKVIINWGEDMKMLYNS